MSIYGMWIKTVLQASRYLHHKNASYLIEQSLYRLRIEKKNQKGSLLLAENSPAKRVIVVNQT